VEYSGVLHNNAPLASTDVTPSLFSIPFRSISIILSYRGDTDIQTAVAEESHPLQQPERFELGAYDNFLIFTPPPPLPLILPLLSYRDNRCKIVLSRKILLAMDCLPSFLTGPLSCRLARRDKSRSGIAGPGCRAVQYSFVLGSLPWALFF